MKHLFITGLTICLGMNVFGQAKEFSCSHVKSKQNSLKTPTMTPAQLAETEKYDVSFYALNLNMTNTSTYLSGNGSIHGKTLVATDSITFELFKTFTIDSILLNTDNANYNRHESVVKVAANLPANSSFKVTVYYKGTSPTAATNPLGGSGMTNDVSGSWGSRVTWSLSEPFSAYEWFPVKQVLRDKADSCALNITVANNLKAGSNGILESVVDNGNGTSTYKWFHRHPIAYYLISTAVAEYNEYTTTAFTGTPDEILIQNYIYTDPQVLTNFQAEIDLTADFIELFSDLYGMYPFANEKYGHCMAPISGGMEHQTMTTQGFFEKKLTTHELAHQWWGNYVTCDTWANIWINEGFASYSEDLMLEHLFPILVANNMSQRHSSIMTQTGGSVWVADSSSDASIFDSRLTYDKGAAIIHTMRYLINNDALFFTGLQTFLNTYKNKTATALQFKVVMENVTGYDLTAFFDQWYFGQGYPRYTVKWNNESGSLKVNIQHVSTKSTTPLFTVPVELTLARSNASDTIVKVNISSNNEIVSFPDLTNVTNITKLDPNNWIINKLVQIAYEQNLSIETTNEVSTIQVFPVPATDELTIKSEKNVPYKAVIYDIKGNLVDTIFYQESTTISLKKYQSGEYIIKIVNENNLVETHRFIKF